MTGDEPTGLQRRILAALGTFRLLNAQQLVRVGVAGSAATIRAEARVLERKNLVGASPPEELRKKRARLVSGVTALPCLYWLTDRGAEILATGNPETDPRGARREMGDAAQITHRIKIVDTHIALRLWAASAGVEVKWFVTDFEPGSGGLRKPTTIEYHGDHGPRFTPDALANIIGPDGLPRLLVLEIERGRRDGKRLTEFRAKLDQLREVSEQHEVEEWASRPLHAPRFMIVFATRELRDKALTTWPDPKAAAWQDFYVKCDDDLADFNGGWWRPGGRSQRPLFSWATAPQGQATSPLPAA